MEVVDVVIPAFNEENAIGEVLKEIDRQLVREVIVVNNGSTDNTEKVALKNGATVLFESNKGYGSACLKGIEYVKNKEVQPDILVFIDADHSDYPGEMKKLTDPVKSGMADLVIGSRSAGKRQRGSMTPQQIFGNWLATRLMKIFYGVRFTDLGPFRAISYEKLLELGMKDKDYGWTVEMQLKAAKHGLKCMEVPVNYRPRIGKSKVSGTVKGTIMAGYKIIYTIFRYI